MERHRLVESFNCAIEGVIYVLKTQRNMRIHFAAAAIILVAAIVLNISPLDFLFICLAIFFVLFAEMINTAAELTIDMISETYHPLARLVKDIGAGATLLASVNAVVIGYFVLVRYLERPVRETVAGVKSVPFYVTFIALLAVIALTVIVKIRLHRGGTPMRGGMPSVHSAVAFAAAAIVTMVAPASVLIIGLAYLLALMVLQSRVAGGIHTFYEAILGALFGTVITLLLYQAYRHLSI